ncbi:MAG TPA: hypothetical protein VNY83_00845, partial [Solirubrobacterales bacterium]|nr:hypothetical protein [Solirubrobacterales bacterium]
MTEVQLDIDSLKREGTEVARYRISSGRRLVIGRRGAGRGGAELLDVPANGIGRAYHVDRGWHDGGVMEAFVRDYVEQAKSLDQCPMSAAAIGVLVDSTESD